MRRLTSLLRRFLAFKPGNNGQTTVEYLIVGLALLAMVVALGALSGRLQDGLFVQHAIDSASHAAGHNTMGVIGDVLLY